MRFLSCKRKLPHPEEKVENKEQVLEAHSQPVLLVVLRKPHLLSSLFQIKRSSATTLTETELNNISVFSTVNKLSIGSGGGGDHSTQRARKHLNHSVSKAAVWEALRPIELGAEDHFNGDIPPLNRTAPTTIRCVCKHTTHIKKDYFMDLVGLSSTSKISAEHLQWNREFNTSKHAASSKSTIPKRPKTNERDQKEHLMFK